MLIVFKDFKISIDWAKVGISFEKLSEKWKLY